MKERSPRSIEISRDQWAENRKNRFTEDKLDLMIVSKQQEQVLDYPIVGNHRKEAVQYPIWVPRVNPVSGAVIVSRWGNYSERTLDFDKDIIFGGKRKNEALKLPQYPKSWNVKRLIPVNVEGGLEPAMRQQDLIAHDYSEDGVEKGKVDEVFQEINEISEEFINGNIKTQDDLSKIAFEAEMVLQRNGMLHPRSNIWKTVIDNVAKAAQKDSIGRVNPMISRILLRSAFLENVKNEIIMPNTEGKAEKIYRWLEEERVYTRVQIENAATSLEMIIGLNEYRGLDVFENPQIEHKNFDYWIVSQLIKAISKQVLSQVQCAPYLGPVTIARMYLTGAYFENSSEEKLINQRLQYIKMPKLREGKCAEDYLRSNDSLRARQHIKYAHGILKALLNDPDNRVITTF